MRADTCVANSRESDNGRFARLQKQQCMSPFGDRAKDRVRAVETEHKEGEGTCSCGSSIWRGLVNEGDARARRRGWAEWIQRPVQLISI
ncbi:unnamed protein product [Lasius platythorax]|uniref:Uncharacterized protein n=1 Tax=Lasius platythorax TaxID=488582 RepID=A0AAV2PCC3_9HYME